MLPRSAWPIKVQFAATPGMDDMQVEEAIATASRELSSRVAGAARRSEIRAVAVDADEADAVLADLNFPPDSQTELRAYCREHPGGRLIIAWCDYQPNLRRTTIL